MRKLLLGSTAVAAAALFAPNGALAQGADPFGPAGPAMVSHRLLEVRVGGYFRFYYSYTDQDFSSVGGVTTGKSDFAQEMEIHIVANGKAANGLRYGAAIEIQNDSIVQAQSGLTGSGAGKNTLDLDEAWGFVAGTFGQVRGGDEDTVIGLMSTGNITGYASGGLDGDFYDSVISPLRPQFNMPSDPGDNTKIVYMSPQFFGFDFGASFAFNNGEGTREGCLATGTACDRFSAGPGGRLSRRNELTALVRWRGSFGAFGLGAHAAYMGADAIKNTTGQSGDRLAIGHVGAQATAFGFTVGGQYLFGRANANYTPLANDTLGAGGSLDDRNMSTLILGASYTIDAFTVGAHYAMARSAGNQSILTGGRRDRGINVGVTYRIAPGLEAIAEYTNVRRREDGFNFLTGASNGIGAGPGRNVNSSVEADVFLAGVRFAF